MEDKEIREMLLCVLRNNIQHFKKIIQSGSWYAYYSFEDITLHPTPIYKEVKLKPKNFWQKEIDRNIKEYETFSARYGEFTTQLTKEEYNEILEIRREKIKDSTLKQLTKICDGSN